MRFGYLSATVVGVMVCTATFGQPQIATLAKRLTVLRPSSNPKLPVLPAVAPHVTLPLAAMRARALAEPIVASAPASPSSWSLTISPQQLAAQTGNIQVSSQLTNSPMEVDALFQQGGNRALYFGFPQNAIDIYVAGLSPGSAYVMGCALNLGVSGRRVQFTIGTQTTTLSANGTTFSGSTFADSIAFIAPQGGGFMEISLSVLPEQQGLTTSNTGWEWQSCTIATPK